MGRYALLVGISNYETDLTPLPSAVRDVEALQRVLLNPEIGGFSESDVTVLRDKDRQEIERAIYNLFANRRTEDLLLFYFSGHGVTDSRSDFYLTSKITSKEELPPTAISANYVHDQMDKSRSKHQVVILDCCHSGAFPKGMTAKGVDTVNVLPKLGGEGRAILTASDSTQYAFEQKGFDLSLYTHFLVEGLEKGAADLDGDGEISVDELYDYVREKVKNVNDSMSPEFYPVKEGHRIILAKSPKDDPKLKYRKEVEQVYRRANGKISGFARRTLDGKRNDWDISLEDAKAIEEEILRPYREYAKKLEDYEKTLSDEIAAAYPFSPTAEEELQDYEKHLGLREEDITAIKNRIVTPKQAEYEQRISALQTAADRLRQEEERKQAEAERLMFERISALQTAADRLRQEEERKQAETERLKRQQEEQQKQAEVKKQQSDPSFPEFEYEYVKVRIVKEGGLLGIGASAKVQTERKRGKAQYVQVDLGSGITLDLVRIPVGSFMMGMPAAERKIALENALKYGNKREDVEAWLDRSTPQHQVELQALWMGRCAVTNAQWQAVMGTKPSEKYDRKFQGDKQPVVGVSWHDARAFCKKLSEKVGREVRLPTEAEWEYACRAGTTTPFAFGETITTDLVNFDGNYPYGDAPKGEFRERTVDVDSFSPNPWGLYQMHGNVWEWCLDEFHDSYSAKPDRLKKIGNEAWGDLSIDENDNCSRLLRGGSWYLNAGGCRSARRSGRLARVINSDVGFRVVVFSSL